MEVDVIAVDNCSEYKDHTWFPDTIKKDGTVYLQKNNGCPDRTLMLCWPRFGNSLLKEFKGNTLIFIGESYGGATWALDSDNKEWILIDEIIIPTWACIHDVMLIYKRDLHIT